MNQRKCFFPGCQCTRCAKAKIDFLYCARDAHDDMCCPDDPNYDPSYQCPDFIAEEEPKDEPSH